MSFGSNVKKYRKAKGMTQQELADALGYTSKSMISTVESDKKSPACSQLKNFAKALGVSMLDLLAETPKEHRQAQVYAMIPRLVEVDDNTFNIIQKIIYDK